MVPGRRVGRGKLVAAAVVVVAARVGQQSLAGAVPVAGFQVDDVRVALVQEGGKRSCQKVARRDEEKKGIEGEARGCESSPETGKDGGRLWHSGE